MGITTSHAAPSTPPPPPPTTVAGSVPVVITPAGLQQLLPVKELEITAEKSDYLNLPCPIKYEEIQREAYMALKPELFEGLRFEFNKPLNQHFSLSHSLCMGNMEVPSQSAQVVKIPSATYEFGANILDQKMMIIGRLLNDGRVSARIAGTLTDRLGLKINAQLTSEPHFSHGMLHLDYRGSDYQAQLQLGNNAYYGGNYMQSITPSLACGGEVFWLGHQRRSGVGIASRWNTDKCVATGQVATTGMVSLTYVQKVTEKISLASEFMCNVLNKESSASVGYDYIFRQCRLRGRIDTNGCVAAYLEERLNVGVNLLFSAEVDHWKKDYKFGFGMTVGE